MVIVYLKKKILYIYLYLVDIVYMQRFFFKMKKKIYKWKDLCLVYI